MSVPRVGFHVRLRERAIPKYAGHYGKLSIDDTFTVTHLDSARGRGAVYAQLPGTDRTFLFWRGDVSALSRCALCDREGHTMATASVKVCGEMQL